MVGLKEVNTRVIVEGGDGGVVVGRAPNIDAGGGDWLPHVALLIE